MDQCDVAAAAAFYREALKESIDSSYHADLEEEWKLGNIQLRRHSAVRVNDNSRKCQDQFA